jgi:hypothetical protein
MKVARLSAPHTGRLYRPGNIPGTHFYYRLSQPQGHSADGRIVMKNSDTIGNRTRDLSTCRAIPQPTAPQAAYPVIWILSPFTCPTIEYRQNLGLNMLCPKQADSFINSFLNDAWSKTEGIGLWICTAETRTLPYKMCGTVKHNLHFCHRKSIPHCCTY